MQSPLSLVGKISAAVVVGLLAYRGARLYLKNDITIYVTEVIHLPTRAAHYCEQPPSRNNNADLTLNIEGKVEMETCVMSSYRFLLKLTGHVQSSLFDTSRIDLKKSRSSRHRVLSLQASNEAMQSSLESLSDSCSLIASPHSNSSRRHGPSLVITAVDPIVDAYEADATGTLAFTPACVDDGVLCLFTCVTSTRAPNDVGSPLRYSIRDNLVGSSNPSVSTSPLSVGDTALRSILVRSCFLESDREETYCHRLIMEVEFLRPVFGARVLVQLPNRHCKLLRSHIDGVGSVSQLPNRPRECVWDIGTVSEAMCAVYEDDTPPLRVAEEAIPEYPMSSVIIPVASSTVTAKSLAKLELVFKQAPPALFFGEEYEEKGSTNSDEEDDDYNNKNNKNIRCSSVGYKISQKRLCQSATGRALAATDSSRRARKRKERARKANEKSSRIEEIKNSSGVLDAEGEDVPTVELMFSVNQLLSGTSVKKLQIVEERSNWIPRSRIDRHILRRIMPGLEKLKLRKYAHYTTWLVQPVEVSRL